MRKRYKDSNQILLTVPDFMGYPFGLEVDRDDGKRELHGSFASVGDAMAYGTRLMRDFTGYTTMRTVKIEVPNVGGYVFEPGEGWIRARTNAALATIGPVCTPEEAASLRAWASREEGEE